MIGRLLLRFWDEGVWARVLITLVFVLALEINPIPQTLLESVEQAQTALRVNDPATAAKAFYRAYEYQPWVFDFLASAAEAELNAGHYYVAERYLNHLEGLRPLRPEEVLWLGSIYAGQGNIDKAIAAWEAGHAQGAEDADSMTQLAGIYVSRGEWAQAARALESLAQRAPTDAGLFYQLGLIQALDEPEKAAVTLAQAISLNESLGPPLLPIRAYLMNPSDDPADLANARLGVLYIGLNEFTLAEEALTRAVALNPAYAEALAYLAYVRARLNKPALGAAQQALALESDSPTVLYLVGLTWKEYGRNLEARTSFTRAYRLDSLNPAFAVEIASTYRAEAAYEWAELWMNEAAYLAGDDLRFRILLVQFYVDEEYLVEEVGLPLAQSLVTEHPDNAQARDALGWAYFQLGQVDRAAEEIAHALTLDPDLARAHLHMAMILESNGRVVEATIHYARASSLEPDGPFGALARRALDRLGAEG